MMLNSKQRKTMKHKQITFGMILGLILFLSYFPLNQKVHADWEIGEIENIEDWIVSSNVINITRDYRVNLFFSYINETLGIEFYPNLSFHTEVNVPLNVTGYLSREIKKEEAKIGIQIGSNLGNVTLGLNGTIIGITPITDTFIVGIQEGEKSAIANFEALIGENLSIPINFNPIIFSLDDLDIPEVESVALAITPNAHLTGSISLTSTVNGEKLTWNNNSAIFFEDVEVLKNMSLYNIVLSDILFEFTDVVLKMDSIGLTLILETVLGEVSQDFNIDLGDVEWEEGQQMGAEFILFLLDTLITIEDQTLTIHVDEAAFPISGLLITLVIFTSFVWIKRRRID
ncbi:MAG: hypothetical protein KAS63_05760 [Candidatus Heimdallarchaeota archaeon]|nr:hypothetical protein [Candidatus Heimdallarchaeota archaeon]MCK4954845.1 hypothetical protein [Candidatus Heimdallarchaeota archaeon]